MVGWVQRLSAHDVPPVAVPGLVLDIFEAVGKQIRFPRNKLLIFPQDCLLANSENPRRSAARECMAFPYGLQ
jgi:hypothetical protein